MLENKYYSKIPYILAIIGSIALIAFYISTRTMNIPSIGVQDDIGTIDILSKVMQVSYSWYIDIYCKVFNNNMEKCYNNNNIIPASSAEILEYEVRKMQKRTKARGETKNEFSGY